MKKTRLINNVIGGSYESDVMIAGCAVSQNLYAESVEDASNGFYFTTSLRSVEGERVVLDLSAIPNIDAVGCRGMFVASDNSVFAAFGSCVVRIRKNPIKNVYGYETIYHSNTLNLEKVCFAETGGINSHVCWVDGGDIVFAYPLSTEKATGVSLPVRFHTPIRVYKTADEIVQDTEFHVRPTQICSINGCLVINDPDTDTWYYTDAYVLGGTNYIRNVYALDANGNIQYEDGDSYKVKTKEVNLWAEEPSSYTSYLWLDRYSKPRFQTAEYSADKISGMTVCGDLLFVIGEKSMQIYNQEASTDAQGFSSMVFSSVNRDIRDLGTKAKDSIVELDGNVIFLGSSARGERSVWMSNGGAPVRISTNVMEREWEGLRLEDAFSFGWMQNGHHFYCITVPAVGKTYCYDFATRQWHNRSTRLQNGTDGAWWVRFAVNLEGDICLGSNKEKVIAVLDKNKYDDFRGEPIIKRRTAPCLTNDFSPFMVNDLLLLWNTGTTNDINNENDARNPVVMLEVSFDGGNTFGPERWGYGGKVGMYSHRTIWYGIGAGNMIVFRFTISDRANVVITGCKISHTPLSNF